jgi:LmbE family N-acetylglucosaminyl deacetylase
VARSSVMVRDHRDGYLPYSGAKIKDEFEELKRQLSPDLIFTHYRHDLHQDHRLVSELTRNTWRNNLILEYEIPKFDGDFGSPNLFSRLPSSTLDRKVELVLKHYCSQVGRHWFTADLLKAVARIRGMECVAPDGVAEGFYSYKAVF